MPLLLIGIGLLIAAAFIAQRYVRESAGLATVVREVLGADTPAAAGLTEAQALERLNQWVYNNQGFAKNEGYFVLRRLGPTPAQVLERGGDCADKSRLLSTLLHQAGIDNTVVMLYSRDFEAATHTVVETRTPGLRAAADPVFDLVFPDPQGTLLGVEQLRDHHDLLLKRLDDLTAERGLRSKVAFYDRETESYRWPRTVNWERFTLTRLVGSALRFFTPAPDLITRPRILEEPVALIAALIAGVGLLATLVGILSMRW